MRLNLNGDLYTDEVMRRVYATDASIYEQLPAAVAIPVDENDIRQLIVFANQFQIGLIPRTAGTSLAGQVVGDGIVVDVSKHFTRVLEICKPEAWVKVQPGVIRDELNLELEKHGLYFAPETSTSNRAMIGGMLGNNSCGANSIVYGTTRDHALEVSGFLSNGKRATFGPVTNSDFQSLIGGTCAAPETKIYSKLFAEFEGSEINNQIRCAFPKPGVQRRNTGYALDRLVAMEPFGGQEVFNLTKVIAGSEGTLFFATEVKLNCVPMPPTNSLLICAHFDSLSSALQATLIAMKHRPFRCELIDNLVIEGARCNLLQQRALTHFVGDPAAVLLIEVRNENQQSLDKQASGLVDELKASGLGYAYPVFNSPESDQVWSVRKSGLGVVNNCPGPAKPTSLIEDTAVCLEDLPGFVTEVDKVLADQFKVDCVHYGHAGAGELHFRPTLDLANQSDIERLHPISLAVAKIVKKYQGSLSGEHGDGRLRSQHLEMMFGEEVVRLLQMVKAAFDPDNLFNPGKIVEPVRMDRHLKVLSSAKPGKKSIFRFGDGEGLLEAASKCTGSGDCRKTNLAGGTMCPSYMATRDEYDSTRARANLLRQMLTQPGLTNEQQIDDHQVNNILRLCLSCKACKSECPSNVDMARIKAEFTQSYFDQHGIPRTKRMFSTFEKWCRRLSKFSGFINLMSSNAIGSALLKRSLGIHKNRSLPNLTSESLKAWFQHRHPLQSCTKNGRRRRVFLFCDEFTNFVDVGIGKATVELLELLGYEVQIPTHLESGRSAISIGLVRTAKTLAEDNVKKLTTQLVGQDILIGIEPSALLTLRDEYPDLVDDRLEPLAQRLARQTILVDEFLALEMDNGKIDSNMFSEQSAEILVHGHCHQKALSSMLHTQKMLSILPNSNVQVLDSGCCGMAGYFGYEHDKYELSMQIGELVLFPAVRNASADTIIVATGTSCRHQISDGTGRQAIHPVELLRERVRCNLDS